MVTGVAISIPANVEWQGQLYALPHHQLIQSWPALGRALASSERLRVSALIAATLLGGLAFAEILRHLRLADSSGPMKRWVRAGVAVVVCAVMYVQYEWAIGQPAAYGPQLRASYPGDVPHDSPVLHALRKSRGPTIELPLPAAVLDPWTHATAMYRSIFHWQPLLNGYGSFWPAGFPALMRTAARLPQADAIRALRRETGLSFILVRKREPAGVHDGSSKQREEWLRLAASGGRDDLELVATDDELLLFRIVPPTGRDHRPAEEMW
jgi:hypothetical protein